VNAAGFTLPPPLNDDGTGQLTLRGSRPVIHLLVCLPCSSLSLCSLTGRHRDVKTQKVELILFMGHPCLRLGEVLAMT